jgi:hypothetical protein
LGSHSGRYVLRVVDALQPEDLRQSFALGQQVLGPFRAVIVDDNPLKHGYLTPGRHLPIRPTAALAAEPPGLWLLLLAWNFADEILGNVRHLRPGRGDTAVFYVPHVRTTPI